MTGKRTPNFFPQNYAGATFKMGDHEFPMSIFFEKDPFAPERVRHKRVKFAPQQQSAEIIALAAK